MIKPFEMVRDTLFSDCPSWFFEEENHYTIRFGDKNGQWFTLYTLGDAYVIISAYKLNCPHELLDSIAAIFQSFYKSQGEDVLVSCRGMHASGPDSELAKDICNILQKGLRGDLWSPRLPNYSWVPSIGMRTSVLVSGSTREVITSIDSIEKANAFVMKEHQQHEEMKIAEISLHEWITSLCPNVVCHRNASYEWDTLYYVPDGFAVKFSFRKEWNGHNVSFHSSYYLDNEYFNHTWKELDEALVHTKQKVIEYISKNVRCS